MLELCVFGKLIEYFLSLFAFEVQGYAFLIAVDLEKGSARVADLGNAAAEEVAALDSFNFDDLCAEVGKNHRAERAGKHCAQVKNFYTFKR